MYKHILIATDGSELSAKAVYAGLKLAKALNANATALTVTEPWTAYVTAEVAIAFPFDEYERSAVENARRILAAVDDAAQEIAVNCKTIHVKDQYPPDGILDVAKSQGCDLIVMASHGRRGLGRVLLGSAAVSVLTHSTVPVLICR